MGVRRAGAVIQIAGDAVFVVMVFVTVTVLMDMGMGMAVLAAIGMVMGVLMRIFVRSTLDLHFTRATTTNCTHTICSYSISISLTRISLPPVGCT